MTTPNPMLLAGLKRHEDKMRRRGRPYGLGERNPETLPGVHFGHNRSENEEENREGTRRWKRLGKLARAGKLIGNKYV